MNACILTDDDGRVKATVLEGCLEGGTFVDIPEEIDLNKLHHYKVLNGTFIYDPIPEEEAQPTQVERIAALEEQNAMLIENNNMLTECVLEMSSILYA